MTKRKCYLQPRTDSLEPQFIYTSTSHYDSLEGDNSTSHFLASCYLCHTVTVAHTGARFGKGRTRLAESGINMRLLSYISYIDNLSLIIRISFVSLGGREDLFRATLIYLSGVDSCCTQRGTDRPAMSR